jgi:hypothetical protein
MPKRASVFEGEPNDVPNPDIAVCLHAAAETVYIGRRDLVFDELAPREAAQKAVVARMKSISLVGTCGGIDPARDQAIRTALDRVPAYALELARR